VRYSIEFLVYRISEFYCAKLFLPYMYRCRSRSGSNQPEAMSVDTTTAPGKSKPTKKRKQVANKQKGKSLLVTFDSPAMATRSKKTDSDRPAMWLSL